jgi:methyl-accepting chemotaxis protein
VEAARAGEAGAGFAVVADEVRNLAMRAAEAAKSTADLIEGTVKKVNDGSELVNRTNEAFTQVAQSSKKVGELVSEIAAASNEQAQGIGQVNTAVTQMDKVVQLNAGNAEESAGASEELNAQAEQMKVIVQELVAMVGGGVKQENRMVSSFKIKKMPNRLHATHTNVAANALPASKVAENKKTASHKKAVSPDEMIPLDEDFADF